MLVNVRPRLGVVVIHENVYRVEIELEDGQRFSFKEYDGVLSVSVAGHLMVLPCATNIVLLEAAD